MKLCIINEKNVLLSQFFITNPDDSQDSREKE